MNEIDSFMTKEYLKKWVNFKKGVFADENI